MTLPKGGMRGGQAWAEHWVEAVVRGRGVEVLGLVYVNEEKDDGRLRQKGSEMSGCAWVCVGVSREEERKSIGV